MNRLDLNAQKLFSTILKFSIKEGEREKIFYFQKIQIFEHNSVPSYCSVRKCQIRRQDLNAETQFSAIVEFWNFERWYRRK